MKYGLLVLLIIGSVIACSNHPVSSDGQPVDHSEWTALLQEHVTEEGWVNYTGFIKDSIRFNAYLDLLRSNHPNSIDWTESERLAYWINAYNAFTVALIIEHYPVEGIKEIKRGIPFVNSVWDIKFIEIGGEIYDLNNIEHGIIRKEFEDPRIHMAVNCASFSCPPLLNEAFVADRLDAQLDQVTRAFLKDDKRNRISENEVALSKIFSWYRFDFKQGYDGVLDFVNQHTEIEVSEKAKIRYLDYNWSLNEVPIQ